MYLELAEEPQDYLQEDSINPMEYYVQVPDENGGFQYVREDMLDNLPDDVFLQVLDAGEYMSEGDYLASKASRMARRARRIGRKNSRIANRRAGGGAFNKLIDTAGGVATSIFGGGKAPASQPDQTKGFNIQAGVSDTTTGIMSSPVIMVGGLLLIAGAAYAIASRSKKK